MDRKTIVAVALCVLFLILYRPLLGWLGLDHYLERTPRRPNAWPRSTRLRRDTSLAALPPADALPPRPAQRRRR